jgi:hypothetical protein
LKVRLPWPWSLPDPPRLKERKGRPEIGAAVLEVVFEVARYYACYGEGGDGVGEGEGLEGVAGEDELLEDRGYQEAFRYRVEGLSERGEGWRGV